MHAINISNIIIKKQLLRLKLLLMMDKIDIVFKVIIYFLINY